MIFKFMQQIARELSAQVDDLVGRLRVANTDVIAGFGRELVQRVEIDKLKQELETLNETARSRFESLQSTEVKCQELAAQLAAMKQERDDIQLRLHAVDHAYSEQQKMVQWEKPVLNSYKSEVRSLRGLLAGRDKTIGSQRELIARQRQFIRTLYTSRNKLKKPRKDVIQLSKAETQSGLDRVRWAELLIRQLPETHDGRNSWLLNFAREVK